MTKKELTELVKTACHNIRLFDIEEGLEENLFVLQECVVAKSLDPLHDFLEGFGADCTPYYLEVEKYLKAQGQSNEEVENFIGEHGDDLYNVFHELDESKVVKQILKKTKIPVRIVVFTNHDCFEPEIYEAPFGYEDYLKDMIDLMRVNPKDFAKYVDVDTAFPNSPNRSPVVEPKALANEIYNNMNYSLLTILGTMDGSDFEAFINRLKNKATVKIHEGCSVGLFDHSNGGGTMFDAKVIKDFSLKLGQYGKTKYDYIGFIIDEKGIYGYSTKEVYGNHQNSNGKIS